jgi:hypothetical protein
MTLYFIIPMLIGNIGAAASALWQQRYDLALLMGAGVLANASGLMMAMRS